MTGRDEVERPAGYRRMNRERFIERMLRDAEKRLAGEDVPGGDSLRAAGGATLPYGSDRARNGAMRGRSEVGREPEPVKREPVRPRSTGDVVFQYIIDQHTKYLHDRCRQSRSFRRTGKK